MKTTLILIFLGLSLLVVCTWWDARTSRRWLNELKQTREEKVSKGEVVLDDVGRHYYVRKIGNCEYLQTVGMNGRVTDTFHRGDCPNHTEMFGLKGSN